LNADAGCPHLLIVYLKLGCLLEPLERRGAGWINLYILT
jgi:hypothetical protein